MAYFNIKNPGKYFTPDIIWKGRMYYQSDRVLSAKQIDGQTVSLVVQGEKNYDVTINKQGNKLVMKCTCPYAEKYRCKHMAAALLYLNEHDVIANQALEEIAYEDEREEMAGIRKMFRTMLNGEAALKSSDRSKLAKCIELIEARAQNEQDHLEMLWILLEVYISSGRRFNAEEGCSLIFAQILPLAHSTPEKVKERLQKLMNDPRCSVSADQLAAGITLECTNDQLLCEMAFELLQEDKIQVPFDRKRYALVLMRCCLKNAGIDEKEGIYESFGKIDDDCLREYISYLCAYGKAERVIELSTQLKMSQKSDFENLISAYDRLGKSTLKQSVMVDYFMKFPSKDKLDALLNELDEEQLEKYRARIVRGSKKIRDVYHYTCTAIGNTSDLYYMLQTGGLSMKERVEIVSRHVAELYDRDSRFTINLLKRDLNDALKSYAIPKSLAEELVFALAKFPEGREFLNGLAEEYGKNSGRSPLAELIEKILEETSDVYCENDEI